MVYTTAGVLYVISKNNEESSHITLIQGGHKSHNYSQDKT